MALVGHQIVGRSRVTVLMAVAASVVAGITCGSARAYSARASVRACTVLSGSGPYAFGIVFSGTKSEYVTLGCQRFVAGSHFRLQWGVHNPGNWIVSAEYVYPALSMTALLIAPRSIESAVFVLANRSVFTGRGWILVKRH